MMPVVNEAEIVIRNKRNRKMCEIES